MADRDEIQRIAAAMNALRPDWPVRSLVTFLERHHSDRSYRDLAIAGTAIATDPKTQTPNLLNEHGPWWGAAQTVMGNGGGSAVPAATDPRCTVYGHEHYRLPCRGCRADELAARAAEEPVPTELGALTPEQVARNTAWAKKVRASIGNHPDPRAAAAGEREDD